MRVVDLNLFEVSDSFEHQKKSLEKCLLDGLEVSNLQILNSVA